MFKKKKTTAKGTTKYVVTKHTIDCKGLCYFSDDFFFFY